MLKNREAQARTPAGAHADTRTHGQDLEQVLRRGMGAAAPKMLWFTAHGREQT